MPLQRRLPKFGFKNPFRKEYKAVNIDVLQTLVDKHGITSIDAQTLIDAGYLSKNDLVKILGNGTLTAKVEVKAHAFSKKAVEAIEAVQGTAVKL
jgi:large subunit ribosomal protein L15